MKEIILKKEQVLNIELPQNCPLDFSLKEGNINIWAQAGDSGETLWEIKGLDDENVIISNTLSHHIKEAGHQNSSPEPSGEERVYLSPSERYSPLVSAAIDIINTEFADIDGVKDVSDRLEVTSGHLIKEFREETGITPGRYISINRLDYAEGLLLESDLPISIIAAISGFSDPGYFGKRFKLYSGYSPGIYRELKAGSPKKYVNRKKPIVDSSIYL